MTRRRISALLAAALATLWFLLPARPAAAHGVGSRGDLPVPAWQAVFAAAVAVAASFAVLMLAWRQPRLRAAAEGRGGWRIDGVGWRVLACVGRILGVAVLVLVLTAGLLGSTDARENLAPVAVYVVLWVGVLVAAAVLGDIWRVLSPWRTLAAVVDRWRPGGPARSAPPRRRSAAAVALGAFAWLELAYHEPDDVRLLGALALAYTVVLLAGVARYGAAWLDDREGFGVLFGLVAALAPIVVRDGRLRFRWPVTGLARLESVPGTTAVIVVVLGSTTFDGVSRTVWWRDVLGDRVGWDRTIVNTAGLLGTIVAVGAAYVLATTLADRLGRNRGTPLRIAHTDSLVPIALGYAVAHYFSLLVFEGQSAWFRLSDPYGQGWNLLGTADHRIDYTVVSTTTIAWVQVVAITLGHIAGVIAAHDRTLEVIEPRRSVVAQYPMLVLMVGYTVVGLALLLEA